MWLVCIIFENIIENIISFENKLLKKYGNTLVVIQDAFLSFRS